MFEGNGDAAVTVLDIEHHGVAAHLAPPADDTDAVITGRHQPSEINSSDFKIALYPNRLLHDWHRQKSGNNHRLTRLQKCPSKVCVRGANGCAQLTRRQIGGL